MTQIKDIKAFEIFDSRGNPTVEVRVALEDKTITVASCPSGASVGTYEAVELRDKNQNRFGGMGVLNAVENVNTTIAQKLIGTEVNDQRKIDKILIELDGTPNKSKLGANATLAVSMSIAKAAAKSANLPLYAYLRQYIQQDEDLPPLHIPTPLFNIINGGKHAENTLDFQEFMIIPASSKSYQEALMIGINVYNSLKKVLEANRLSTLIGDEGGFGPNLTNNMEAFSYIRQAVENVNLRFGFDVFFGLDAASNSFFSQSRYIFKENNRKLSTNDLVSYYEELDKKHPLLYLEDGIAEDDLEGWQKLSQKISDQTILVGDDLTVTNPFRLQMALDKKAITGIIIKPNQIGTVMEALAVVEMARKAGLKITVSHRSGETNDDFIADFAVAVSADYAKFGSPARGERIAKYNRLLSIDRQIQGMDKNPSVNKK